MAAPRGARFRPRQLWWRADRHPRPRTFLPVRAIRPEDAWCEDPSSRHYNQPMRLKRDRGGDRLTRDDHLYDFIVEIDHNTSPRDRRPRQRGVPASGAAEFFADRGLRLDDAIGDAAAVGSGSGRRPES